MQIILAIERAQLRKNSTDKKDVGSEDLTELLYFASTKMLDFLKLEDRVVYLFDTFFFFYCNFYWADLMDKSGFRLRYTPKRTLQKRGISGRAMQIY